MDTKTCTECGTEKPLTEFYKRNSRPCGYQARCKQCANAWHAKYVKTAAGKRSIEKTKPVARRAGRRFDRSEKGKAKRKRFMQTEKGKLQHRAASARYRIKHRDKINAQSVIAYDVKRGKLPRPDTLPCNYCDDAAIEYHHHNGYEEEHKRDVVPVCKACHSREHHYPLKPC